MTAPDISGQHRDLRPGTLVVVRRIVSGATEEFETFIRITADFPNANDIVLEPDGTKGPIGALPTFGFTPSDDDGATLLLGASIAPMPHPTPAFGSSARLTTYVRLPSIDLSAIVPVPKHAQSVTVLGSFTVAAINALTAPIPASIVYSSALTNPNLDQFAFPIARGVEFVQIDHSDEEGDRVALLLWTIGL